MRVCLAHLVSVHCCHVSNLKGGNNSWRDVPAILLLSEWSWGFLPPFSPPTPIYSSILHVPCGKGSERRRFLRKLEGKAQVTRTSVILNPVCTVESPWVQKDPDAQSSLTSRILNQSTWGDDRLLKLLLCFSRRSHGCGQLMQANSFLSKVAVLDPKEKSPCSWLQHRCVAELALDPRELQGA